MIAGDDSMICDKIRALRESHHLTQAELARQLSITRNGVNSWEQGFSMPSPLSLVELSRLFHVSTDYLLGVDEMSTINVSGLNEKDVALLAELAARLKEKN